MEKVIVIGIAGGTGSGKSTMVNKIKEEFDEQITMISHDYYYKRHNIPFEERKLIIESIKYVDCVVAQISMDKLEAWKMLRFDAIFHGDDWKGSGMYNEVEEQLKSVGCDMVFLPHTDGTSSTMLTNALNKIIEN